MCVCRHKPNGGPHLNLIQKFEPLNLMVAEPELELELCDLGENPVFISSVLASEGKLFP